jgi:OmpA-OmpF porin, OOP family
MKQLILLFILAITVQSCQFGSYPQGSGGYPSGGGNTNGGNSGGNGGDRPQSYPKQTPQSNPQEPTNYPQTPQSRSGRSADKDLVVGNIRLTDQYTILYLTFTNQNQAGEYVDKKTGRTVYDDGSQNVAFQQNAVLIAANGARTFRAVKTENIPFLGDNQARDLTRYGRKLQSGESLNFVAYFERLDKGLENFDMNECNSDAYTCWNMYDLYVKNPSDAYNQPKEPTTEPPTSTDNSQTKTRTKTGKVGEVDHTPTPTPAPVVTNVLVSGIVRDVKTNRPVSATIDYKLSSSTQVVDSVQSFASTGIYKMTLEKGQVYTYSASARGYLVNNDIVDLSKIAGGKKVTKDIYLTPLAVGDKITLKNIYFEVSKSDLLSASFAELNKLVTMMEDNPMMEIRLEGHTDVVGDPEANLELSQDRVDACETYIVKKGIASARIQAVGYGDTRPIVKKGTDEERKVNRRVEFVVLKL